MMSLKEILKTIDHRPWKLPSGSWKFYQEWNETVFLHFQVDVSELSKWVPQSLEIDLYNGQPWVSIVAFTMEKIRPKNLPPFFPVSNFDELNIRTYVKFREKSGVYFLSIEGGNKWSCKIAKAISGLPYRYSEISRTNHHFKSRNLMQNDSLDIKYTIDQEIKKKNSLDKWLTERYALFQDVGSSINTFEIHHLEWPIQELRLNQFNFDYPRFANLIHNRPDRLYYSKGVQVLAWGKRKL